MKKDGITETIFSVVLILSLLGGAILPSPYSHYSSAFFLAWISFIVGYARALEKESEDLTKKIIYTALVFAVGRILFYDATFEERCVQGVIWFVLISIGGLSGRIAAEKISVLFKHKTSDPNG